MKTVILNIILLLASSCLFAQVVREVEQIFFFYDEFNNSQELTIGKNPWASDGLDPNLGEEYIPQVPPGQFGVRFQLPVDTSITTIKDIRFGCYWSTSFYHLIDLRYATDSSTITIEWTWGNGHIFDLDGVMFNNPYTGELLGWFSWSQNPENFTIPSQLDKIQMLAGYGGTLSTEFYEVINPNGGEILESGSVYLITWESLQMGPGINIEFSSDSGTSWHIIVENYWDTNKTYEWIVPNITSSTCLIRLGDYPCSYDISDSVFTITHPVSVGNEKSLPTEFLLYQNYPNPFNPNTKISWQSPVGGHQVLKVFDVLGREVATLVDEYKEAGYHEVEFNPVSGIRNPASGVYFYQLQSGDYIETKKMILLR